MLNSSSSAQEKGWRPLFNGKDLAGWVKVNNAPGTFFVKENMIVTLKGPKGDAFPVKAREKKNVAKLAVGDNVEIHATQALAVEVTTPKK